MGRNLYKPDRDERLAMPQFTSDGFEIAYSDEGTGYPVLLIHGFASSGKVNWIDTGWTSALVEAGYRAITIDNRGHGGSTKSYDPEDYRPRLMAEDAARLLEHLRIERAAVVGYSMGARISAFLALDRPDLVEAVVFGGLGANMTAGMRDSETIIEALLAPGIASIDSRVGRTFRAFAEQTGSDRAALAACMRTSREAIAEDVIRRIDVPALVVVGGDDDVGGPAEPLANLLPQGRAHTIERRDHMRTVGDPKFKAAVLDFLTEVLR